MTGGNKFKADEIMDDAMMSVSGGVTTDDTSLRMDGTNEAENQTKEIHVTEIKSPISVGERLTDAPQISLTGTKKTGKKIPKIIFAKKGKSV